MMSNKVDRAHCDDFTFISQCQKGDVEAFGVLVERYQKKMFNIAYRMTGDYEEAGEVVQEAVQKAINSLDAEFREVLILKDIQELSYEEIGATLNIPGGTVKSRIFRAREALRERLKRNLGDL